MHIVLSYNDAAMAAGNTIATEGHIPKLQPSPELHEPGPEPEPSWAQIQRAV